MKLCTMWSMVLAMIALLVACSHLTPQIPETSPAAAATIDRLLRLNQSLVDLKGIGRMKVIYSDHTFSARMAWAEILPDNKLRMDIMGAVGVKVATLASDGKWVYLRIDQENRFYKKKNGRKLFKRMVDIPITIKDMVQLLGGKIPLAPHQSAVLIDKKNSDPAYALELIDKRGNTCQRIFFNSDLHYPMGFEILESDGTVSYQAEFSEMISLDNYRLPKHLILSSADGNRFELAVERYWLNQPLPPSRFILQPQG